MSNPQNQFIILKLNIFLHYKITFLFYFKHELNLLYLNILNCLTYSKYKHLYHLNTNLNFNYFIIINLLMLINPIIIINLIILNNHLNKFNFKSLNSN